jgi:hypothetical protein
MRGYKLRRFPQGTSQSSVIPTENPGSGKINDDGVDIDFSGGGPLFVGMQFNKNVAARSDQKGTQTIRVASRIRATYKKSRSQRLAR